MSPLRLVLSAVLAMIAFAANSLLCRLALAEELIDPARFTLIRLLTGAGMLFVLALAQHRTHRLQGDWVSAAALFVYAAAFSFAYINLSAGTGALLLFGAVQVTMIGYGLWSGERLSKRQVVSVMVACGGLIWLMLPGVDAPPVVDASLMMGSGVAWGVYSLLGRRVRNPSLATAGNFARALVPALVLLVAIPSQQPISGLGVFYAAASGALASGLGYALWYAVVPRLQASSAATIQLSVPILAAFGGVLLLDEGLSLRFTLASIAVLGGILVFIRSRQP